MTASPRLDRVSTASRNAVRHRVSASPPHLYGGTRTRSHSHTQPTQEDPK